MSTTKKLNKGSIKLTKENINEGRLGDKIKSISGSDKVLTKEVRQNLKKSRDIMFQRLVEWKRIECSVPEAAFYAFFKVKDVRDSIEFAKKLIIDTNVGVAPGIAFGESGEGHLRICFAAKESFINEIMDRLEPALN